MSQAALVDGMATMSQAKVGSALQVFFNLEELSQVWGIEVEVEEDVSVLQCKLINSITVLEWLSSEPKGSKLAARQV